MATQEEYGEYGAMFGFPVFTCFRACFSHDFVRTPIKTQNLPIKHRLS